MDRIPQSLAAAMTLLRLAGWSGTARVGGPTDGRRSVLAEANA
jgi:hypothetical protein